MHRDIVERLLTEVPMARAHRINEINMPNGVWFVFEVRPQPPLDQLQMVIADLDRGEGVFILQDGTLTHSTECNEHSHELNPELKKAIKYIVPQTYRIAVWEGNDSVMNGQPIVISLDPEISYNVYPDHPHISSIIIKDKYTLPESICYTDNPKEHCDDPYTRNLDAIQEICIWLFKHQIWLATRMNGKGQWIGLGVDAIEEDQFYYLRNPFGKCRCGRNRLYHQCHLNQDFENACNSSKTILLNPNSDLRKFKNIDGSINLEEYKKWWVNKIYLPQHVTLNELKKLLL